MSKPSYFEQLKDPRWQKKRLEIFSRDGFRCMECESGERTLHVHHCYYERGLMAWEYPDFALKTLCEDCHISRQESELRIAHGLAHHSLGELSDIYCDILYFSARFGHQALVSLVREQEKLLDRKTA